MEIQSQVQVVTAPYFCGSTPPSPTTNTLVRLSPFNLQSPPVGEQFALSLKIADGKNVAGYQAKVHFDSAALRYVGSVNSDYLPTETYFIPLVIEGNTMTFAASSLSGEAVGDGTLATITFEVVAIKDSIVHLSDVILTDSAGESIIPQTVDAEITILPQLPEDVNEDGIVNIFDLIFVAANFSKQGENIADVNEDNVVNIIDLVLVAAAFGRAASAAAPVLWSLNLDDMPTCTTAEVWLQEARQLNLADPDFQRGILILENLLKTLTPKATALLPNYPNPFNPETWIPYQLASPADVSISIYTADGKLIRTLDLGHQPVGMYHHQSRAAHWDGKNALGELVASGVYFYTLSAGKFSATRKMLIRK